MRPLPTLLSAIPGTIGSYVAAGYKGTPLGLLFLVCGLVASAALLAFSVQSKTMDVSIDAKGVRAGRFLARGSIRFRRTYRDGPKSVILLGSLGQLLWLHVESERVEEILRTLELDASQRREEVRLWAGRKPEPIEIAFLGVLPIVAFGFVWLAASAWVAVLAMVIGFAALLAWAASRWSTLVIGDDGLTAGSALGQSRFISYREVDNLESEGVLLRLKLTNGEEMVFSSMQKDMDHALARVREAMKRKPTELAQSLERGSRDVREWVRSLRRIATNEGFRVANFSRERLWEIFESAESLESERVAAAIALHDELSEDEHARVRVAIERCAHDELRKRMRIAIDSEDEEELAAALDAKSLRSDGSKVG